MGTGSSQGSFLSPPSTAAIASAIFTLPFHGDTDVGPADVPDGLAPAELRAGSATQSTIAIAKSASEMGLHVALLPPPRSK